MTIHDGKHWDASWDDQECVQKLVHNVHKSVLACLTAQLCICCVHIYGKRLHQLDSMLFLLICMAVHMHWMYFGNCLQQQRHRQEDCDGQRSKHPDE